MYSSIVSLLLSCVDRLLDYKKTVCDNAPTTEVLDDKNNLEKACRFAEMAFEHVDKKAVFLKPRDQRKFELIMKKFRKYII